MYYVSEIRQIKSLHKIFPDYIFGSFANWFQSDVQTRAWLFCRPVQDTFEKYLGTDTFKILSEKSMYLDTDTFLRYFPKKFKKVSRYSNLF